MLFNSLEYGLFLPVVVVAHRLARPKWRAGLLLIASYLFYAAWNPSYLPLILGLTLVNGLIGLGLERRHGQPAAGRRLLVLGIATNLLVLGFYKYLLFAFDSVTRLLALVHLEAHFPEVSVFLPLGISFFIFEFIHYLVDVHRGSPAVRSPLKFALFAAFFPTQVAGPIKRYEQFVPQIDHPVPLDWTRLGLGAQLVVTGLFKKMALADNLAPVAGTGFGPAVLTAGGMNAVDAWTAVIAFAFQNYFDFSGYTDIGRGSALLLGYSVPENFRRPYLATSVSEFWRRWHMSLSTWLRDYLYIPLGGNRSHRDRNLMVTMVLGGLWHGANTTFLVWGALHGVYLTIYWTLRGRRPPDRGSTAVRYPRLVFDWAVTFGLICIGWVFFRATNTTHALVVLASMLGAHSGAAAVLLPTQRWFVVGIGAGTLLVEGLYEWRARRAPDDERLAGARPVVRSGWGTWGAELKSMGYLALFLVAVVLQPEGAGRFIYFQF